MYINIKSAGAASFTFIYTKSPTAKVEASTFIIVPPQRSIFLNLRAFYSQSFVQRFQSSYASLIIVTVSTKTKGPTNEIKNPTRSALKAYEQAMTKKNMLKKYLNQLQRTIGTNEKIVYFVLIIRLSPYNHFCSQLYLRLIVLNYIQRISIMCSKRYLPKTYQCYHLLQRTLLTLNLHSFAYRHAVGLRRRYGWNQPLH